MRHIVPIYYHVPKCGGTYVYSKSYELIKELQQQNFADRAELDVFFIHIFDGSEKNILFRILTIQDPKIFNNNIFKPSQNLDQKYNVSISDIAMLFSLIENDIYFIVVCSAGFIRDHILKKYLLKHNIQFNIYMSLRNIYDRELSTYHYLVSKNSQHEINNYNNNNLSFAHFIQQTENWIITNIISENTPVKHIEYKHLIEAIEICKNWFICDISNIDHIIYSIFSNYQLHDLDQKLQKKFTWVDKNETNYDYVPFIRLTDQARLRFLNQTRWDREFYAYFT